MAFRLSRGVSNPQGGGGEEGEKKEKEERGGGRGVWSSSYLEGSVLFTCKEGVEREG